VALPEPSRSEQVVRSLRIQMQPKRNLFHPLRWWHRIMRRPA
jgi:hypothetical protein